MFRQLYVTAFLTAIFLPVVTQAQTCPGTLNPTSLTLSEQGGTGAIALSATAGCAWTASSNASWAQVFPLTGVGPQSISYTIFPNFRSTSRNATFNIAGHTLVIQQAAGIGSQDRRFIRLLYYYHYGRLPTESEVAFHLGSGLLRQQIAHNFSRSDEFNLGGRFIAGLYVGLLGRDAEYSGWVFQRNAMAAGSANPNALVSNFINSTEFIQKYGPLTDEAFVRLLYAQVLGRQPSNSEVASQVAGVASVGRVQVAANFLNSTEFRTNSGSRLTAFLLYATLLQRDGSPDERQDVIDLLESGYQPETLYGVFVTSPEFEATLQ